MLPLRSFTPTCHAHLQLDPPPGYIQSRILLFDKLKAEYDAALAGQSGTRTIACVIHC